jgi:hypothetical protein
MLAKIKAVLTRNSINRCSYEYLPPYSIHCDKAI